MSSDVALDLQVALEHLCCCAADASTLDVLDEASIAELQESAGVALGWVRCHHPGDDGSRQATEDAVCSVADRCAAVARNADELSVPILELVRCGVALLAALLLPEVQTEALDHCRRAERVLAMLEDFSDPLDYFTARVFTRLFRSMAVPEADVTEHDASEGQLLQSVAVWSVAVLVRAAGYEQFNGRLLWDWASRDPFAALVLTKGLLGCDLGIPGSLDAAAGGLAVPRDAYALQDAVWAAIADLPSPDIIFEPCS